MSFFPIYCYVLLYSLTKVRLVPKRWEFFRIYVFNDKYFYYNLSVTITYSDVQFFKVSAFVPFSFLYLLPLQWILSIKLCELCLFSLHLFKSLFVQTSLLLEKAQKLLKKETPGKLLDFNSRKWVATLPRYVKIATSFI